MASAAREMLVSAEEAAQIKSDIEAHFREELLKFRTKQELLRDIETVLPEAILNIYEKRIGMERTAEVRAHGFENPFYRADRQRTSCCC